MCGIENPETTKGGNENSSKPVLRCYSCGKKFAYDNGMLPFLIFCGNMRFFQKPFTWKSGSHPGENPQCRHTEYHFHLATVSRNLLRPQFS